MIVIVIGTVLTLFILFLLSNATIKVSLIGNNNKVTILVRVTTLIPFIGFSKTFIISKPILEKQTIEKGEKGIKWLEKEDLDHPNTVTLVIQIYKYIRKHLYIIDICDFRWQTHVGMGDAATTGMIVGSVWSIKYWIAGILYHNLTADTVPNIRVTPHFQQKLLQTRLECMFTFSIGKAIKVSIGLLNIIRRFHKKEKFKTRNVTKLV